MESKVILRSINRQIKMLQAELKAVRKSMATAIAKNNAHAAQKALLETILGVGEITAVTLIAELPDLDHFTSARQLAAWSGLTPRHHVSGTSGKVRTPISKQGSKVLRRALFMPAMTAKTKNPLLAEFANRLQENGKTPKQAVVAVMRTGAKRR